jgi:hypothetical protein
MVDDTTPPKWLPTAIRLIAIFLVLGGLWGVGSCIWQNSSIRARPDVAVSVRVPLLYVVPFMLTATAGALLWRERRVGAFLSLAVLAAQAISFHLVDGWGYEFTTGAGVILGATGGGDLIHGWSFGSEIDVRSTIGDGSFRLNLVAAVAVVLLLAHIMWSDGRDKPVPTPSSPAPDSNRVSNREDPLQVSGDIINTRPSGTKPR